MDDTRILDLYFARSEQAIASRVEALSSGKTPSFNYAEEMKEIETLDKGVRTKNFVNSTPGTMGDPLSIIQRVKKDCTLPMVMDMEPGTNTAEVFYDADAKMWKVGSLLPPGTAPFMKPSIWTTRALQN